MGRRQVVDHVAALALGLALCSLLRADDFQVNDYTTGTQYLPTVASRGDGAFVVAWWSNGSSGTDNDYQSIQGRLFTSSGTPIGGQFQVNTYTYSYQVQPAVAMNEGGRFVVVWKSNGSNGDDYGFAGGYSIQGRIYASNGTPVGDQFQVNTITVGDQADPAVAMDDDGDFVVAWGNPGVQAKFFLSNGTPLAGQFQVNESTPIAGLPDVAMNGNGHLAVVWTSNGSDGNSFGVQGRVYDSNGVALDDPFQVNTFTTSEQGVPAVAMRGDGRFAVVWWSSGSSGGDTSESSVQGQLFASTGVRIFGEFQVNTYTPYEQLYPDVTMGPSGDFTVVWTNAYSPGSDTSLSSIHSRLYRANGAARGSDFQVNSYTTSDQRHPSAAMSDRGDVVIVWHSDGSSDDDTSSTSIQGSRPIVFLDGFESGNIATWSAAVP